MDILSLNGFTIYSELWFPFIYLYLWCVAYARINVFVWYLYIHNTLHKTYLCPSRMLRNMAARWRHSTCSVQERIKDFPFIPIKINKVNSVHKISKKIEKFALLFFSFQLKWKWQKIDICFWIRACEHKLHIHIYTYTRA